MIVRRGRTLTFSHCIVLHCICALVASGAVSLNPDGGSNVSSSAGVTRHGSLNAGSLNPGGLGAGSLNVTSSAAAATASTSPSSLHTSGEQHDSFEDFDEDVVDASPMQPIGSCVALYPFDGTSFFRAFL